ncbi:AAA family ATPase [Achromobacter xylosoxidans]|uniref:AAA family ATPase n=1 Tax=Alcaligenes xylosoxydans xylosoxydans TaxID=85698 RepID=UPI0022B89424|nr:AAA family ATPase [Achromobacter xylosoxidans]MCZ8392604.1 AAA family ATPase [Achromobacter xylosoxidans]
MTVIEALVLLSGPVAAGKTSVRQELINAHGFDYVRTSSYLIELLGGHGGQAGRRDLQTLGDRLDEETDYRWVLDEVARPGFISAPEQKRWIVDAVRKRRQIEHFRAACPDQVFHVHLHAPEEVLRQRYAARSSLEKDNIAYEIAINHDNEIAARSLLKIADLVLDSNLMSPSSLANIIVEKITLGV